MLSKIKDKILQLNKAAGVEISLQNEGISIHSVVLKLSKNKIIKESEHTVLHDYNELGKKLDTRLPLALSITGKGVLLKKIPPGELTGNPVISVLPAANPDEFYFNTTQFEHSGFIAIIRKELLDGIVGHLGEKGFKVLSVSLGIHDIQYIIPHLNFEDKPVLFSNNYSIGFNNEKEPADISAGLPEQNDKTEYNIGDQYVRSSGIIAFGSATGLLANGLGPASVISNEKIENEKESYRYYKFYKAACWALLAGILSILIINFFFYNYYFTRNQELQAAQLLTKGQLEKVRLLETKLNKKTNFLGISGWDESSRLSFFADKVAGMIPPDILLTSMKIYPVHAKDFFETDRISFKKDTIEINGICEDPTELTEFTNNLKAVQLFRQIGIKNYIYKKETQNGIFYMEIITR